MYSKLAYQGFEGARNFWQKNRSVQPLLNHHAVSASHKDDQAWLDPEAWETTSWHYGV
jgi:hypothetical protein